MAEFKVGDGVSFTSDEKRLTGVVFEGSWEGGHYGISVDPKWDYAAARVWRHKSEVTPIKPKAPKPKTIPARNLSGKHIGRVVTVTLKSGAEVKDKVRTIAHGADSGGVYIVFENAAPPVALSGVCAVRSDGFVIDPDSQVTLS